MFHSVPVISLTPEQPGWIARERKFRSNFIAQSNNSTYTFAIVGIKIDVSDRLFNSKRPRTRMNYVNEMCITRIKPFVWRSIIEFRHGRIESLHEKNEFSVCFHFTNCSKCKTCYSRYFSQSDEWPCVTCCMSTKTMTKSVEN